MSAPTQSATLPPALAAIRANKPLLFLLAGALGGAAGSVLAENVPAAPRNAPFWQVLLVTGLWMGTTGAVLAGTLVAAGEWHQRRDFRPRQLGKVLLFGALAGLVAGAVAQAAFSIEIWSPRVHEYVIRPLCWALMGALLGLLLSRTVPNLGLWRGLLAGAVGGGVGGIGFLLVCQVLPQALQVLARMVGLGTLGLVIAAAMLVVEKLFREASLEVVWAPGETTNFNLGAQAVTIGGGEDHVFVRGLPSRFASIAFTNGVIEYVETATGKRTPLKDGSRLEIGKLNLVIHAAK
jgi:hypothetical protein